MFHFLNVNVVTIFKKCNHTIVEKGKYIFENVFFYLNFKQLYFGNFFLFITALTKRSTIYYICTIS